MRIDSEGRELTQQQQEYFKDSKIRDEDGNLKVVYHGTSREFNIFDLNQARGSEDIEAFFFTGDIDDANGYGENTRAFYLNITNPADFDTAYDIFFKYQGQTGAGIKAREELQSLGYDGVIAEDEDAPEYTEYLAFSPEQIKLVDNANPTENTDIRFSMRNISEADYGTLLEERDYLKDQVELLRKEFEVTKGHAPNMNDIQDMGKKLLKKYNSTYPIDDFNHNMKEIIEFTKNSKVQNYSAVMNAMMKMGRKIAETSQEVDTSMYDQYAELRKSLRTTRIMLNQEQRTAAAERYGTYNDFRKKMMGKLRLVNEGIPLDEMWQQYAEMYPELFNKETGDADQVDEMLDIIGNISASQINVMGGMDVDFAARDIAQEIFSEYFALPSVQTFADARIQELNEAREEYREKLKEARQDYKTRYDKKVYKDKIVRLRNNLAAKITQKKSVPLGITDKVIDVLNEIYRGSQLVQIIMSWERTQGRHHMEKGGMTIYDAKEILKGDLLKAKDKSKRTVNVTDRGIQLLKNVL